MQSNLGLLLPLFRDQAGPTILTDTKFAAHSRRIDQTALGATPNIQGLKSQPKNGDEELGESDLCL